MSAVFGLVALGLLTYTVLWVAADFRAFSRAWDEREARRNLRYLDARRTHPSYPSLRVIQGGRDAC